MLATIEKNSLHDNTSKTLLTMTAPEKDIAVRFDYELERVDVLDSFITYVDSCQAPSPGDGPVVVLIHGNPTSTYIWRNIIPHVSSKYRSIAPDLIGMGHSGKPAIEYRLVDHLRYFDAFMDAVIPSGNVVLVLQDWGSSIGFDWAFRHQDRVVALAFMEFIVPFPTWDDATPPGPPGEIMRAFRNPEQGRRLIIEQNAFVEKALPGGQVRPLTQEEHDYYREPYVQADAREPVYRWPNELPIEGEPADVWQLAQRYHDWLLECDTPKLLFFASPGRIQSPEKAAWFIENYPHTEGVDVGEGMHNLQEDHPRRIGEELDRWLGQIL